MFHPSKRRQATKRRFQSVKDTASLYSFLLLIVTRRDPLVFGDVLERNARRRVGIEHHLNEILRLIRNVHRERYHFP